MRAILATLFLVLPALCTAFLVPVTRTSSSLVVKGLPQAQGLLSERPIRR